MHRIQCSLGFGYKVDMLNRSFIESDCPVRIIFTNGSGNIEATRQLDIHCHIAARIQLCSKRLFHAGIKHNIDKAEDGTYSIVNLENRNLLQNNVSRLPDSELEYIYSIANDIIHDPEKIYCADIVADQELPIEQFLMTWRDKTTNLYYPYFVTASDSGYFVRSLDMLDSPVIAVSCRKYSVDYTFTIYLQVVMEPIPGSHGIYQFIGYDMPMYHTISYLQSMGYPSDG